MSSAKPVSLLGRLAIQMKLIDMDQLNAATSVQSRSPAEGKKLGEVLIELGFINATQLEKIESVQRSVIAKHRARKAALAAPPESGAVPNPARPAEAAPAPVAPAPAVPAPAAPAPAAPAPDPVAPVTAPLLDPEPIPEPAPLPNPEPLPDPEPAAMPVQEVAPPPSPPMPATPPPPAAAEPAAASPTRPELVALPVDDETESLLLRTVVPTTEDSQRLHQLLKHAVDLGSSDIHIHTGAAPRVRVNGILTESGGVMLSTEDTEAMVMSILSESERLELLQHGELDTCLNVPGIGRFRTSVYRQLRGFDAVLRVISPEPPTLDELGLPSWIAKYVNYHQGMVLITGPAGCGKSATMAAMVNLINEERQEHILCIEDPIEVVHPSKRCLVNQRHAGRHTGSFARALRAALREDPDIIVIGELRDLETISLAMTAAETGHFVLATLHTNNAVRTINRMIGAFPSNQQGQVRTMLSESLRAVISQRLVPTADEQSRIAAFELLVINKAIANLIRDEKTIQIRSAIQTGSAHGMMLLEQSLNELVKEGKITREVALELADEKKLITAE